MDEPLIFELSREGRCGFSLPECDVPEKDWTSYIPEGLRAKEKPSLPEVSELDIVRHFTRLSQKNFGVDTHFYPLGSCTMKYNPKINEYLAALPRFKEIHPYQPEETTQGILEIFYELGEYLSIISGLDNISLQPAAGAHGEVTSLLIIKAYFKDKGEKRTKILIPDSAHGTNPASSHLAGYEAISVSSGKDGLIDLQDLKSKVDSEVSCLMLTNPNTLGLFEEQIMQIEKLIHHHGAILYLDGANLNAILGKVRPRDFGVDIMHFNLHKTFSTPHGGGGPGAGPIGVKEFLAPYLPKPVVNKRNNNYSLDYNRPKSIGRIRSFYGNTEAILKTYVYIRMLGDEGLKSVSDLAVLNANYLRKKLMEYYTLPYDKICMHEFVLSAVKQKENKVRAMDIAKRLLDYGFHPPTVYFPLIVDEALMIEPTETESKDTLDKFIEAMVAIDREVRENPDKVKESPHNLFIKRLDEVKAAREPKLRVKKGED